MLHDLLSPLIEKEIFLPIAEKVLYATLSQSTDDQHRTMSYDTDNKA